MNLDAIIDQAGRDREGWKYTSLQALRGVNFAPADGMASVSSDNLPSLWSEAERHRLVFVDGHLRPELSSVADLPEGLIGGDAETGYELQVQGQTCLITAPLELVFVAAKGAESRRSEATLRLTLGANARLTLIEHYLGFGAGGAYAAMSGTKIHLHEQSRLQHVRFQNLSPEDYHLSRTEAHVEKGAFYDHFSMVMGAALSRYDIDVRLAGPLAQAHLHGVYLLRGAQHTDTRFTVDHAAPHTSSREVYRGVLDGKARGVLQGRIAVRPEAQKTDAQLMSKSLLLSGQAEADCKPELEIYADDVKCGHGATVGQLDEDALFYLRARGVPEKAARALLIEAFVGEVIAQLGLEELREFAAKQAHLWYKVPR